MQKKSAVLILLLFSRLIFSQTFILSGKISGHGEALPFASVYLKGTTQGVNSNDEGNYALKLEKGKYTVVFQYVGYSKQEVLVDLTGPKKLDITLKLDGVALKEVVVNAGEDPAYPIMRKAIKKRKRYANPADEYSCQSYIKGLQRLISVPEKFKKLLKLTTGEKVDSTDFGVIYLSESESNYYYRKPGQQKEIMYSSRVSGESKSFSFNQLGQLKFNFYENLISLGGLGARPFVSPLNGNAFLYYKFTLLGTITEDGHVFNKIKVRPKRANDPCFTGIIYIQENSWRLTGLDLQLTKENKINFADTLNIRQLFSPINSDSIWMPVNYNLSFHFSFLGISANGYVNAVVKNYNLEPKLKKDFFSNEVLVIEDGANKKDSTYWNTNRPAPLTREENVDYRKKDSTEKIENTDRYKDSVDRRFNQFRVAAIFTGYNYHKTKKGISIATPGLITSGIQYNTVEGLNLSYNFSATKTSEDFKEQRLSGKARYGFSNYLWGGELGYDYLYNPKKFSRFGVNVKSIVEQFNQQEPISPLINSLYTLFGNDNYMKLYKETAVEGNFFTELVNGFYFKSVIKYAERDALQNSTNRLFIDDTHKLFTSNNPLNPASDNLLFKTNNALTAEVTLAFRFHQKYVSLPGKKLISSSRYPRLDISYKKAIPTLNATANYDLLSAALYDHINLGLFGRFGYRVSGGSFLQSKNLLFTDYKHFLGNQTIINTSNYLSSFRLLPYYTYSANQWFLEAHAEHHFNGFIINKLPLLKKLKVQEVVGAHLLMNNAIKQYYEINFGLEHIFNIIRVDYVLGYGIANKVRSGVTVGLVTRF
jgi:hypothetical protein